uniref:Small RNA 2'-O-methyltransferase n=2 Tax=Clytia hemisphaerica TaxID=252671 RepID=A0A7M5XM45_9CNID
MRHWDHKFEWTRAEFEKWCEDIVKKYPYIVEYSGIGEPPKERSDVGYCSQMGLFTRQPQHPWLNIICQPEERLEYEVVHEFIYPHDSTERSQKILNEICYLVNRFYSSQGEEVDESFDRTISLVELLEYPSINKLQTNLKEVVDILQTEKHAYDLSEDEQSLVVHFKQSDFEKDWEDEDIIVGVEEDLNNVTEGVINESNGIVDEEEESWD